MPDIVLISGSPSLRSRSNALLSYLSDQLAVEGYETEVVSVRDFPAEDLLFAKYDSPAFEELQRSVREARGVIIATPVYKAAYTGSLKTILDILPQQILRGKTVLPLAVGGTLAHLLVLDYALKPVLGALGAADILAGVFVVDSQIELNDDGSIQLDDEIRSRLHRELDSLSAKLNVSVAA